MKELILPFLLALPLTAQAFNSTLLGTHNLHSPYSGCWGYVAPNGREYALLGATTGTVVVDCSVPTAPVERGFFPGPVNGWREIRTWSTYAYVTTEGGGGLQIIDLTNPDAPVLLPTWQPGLFSHAHNIGIDMGTGRIYVCGTNNGMVVADASASPANPTVIGSYLGNYVHDIAAQNGIGYASLINNGLIRLLDLNTWPLQTITDRVTASAFTHNAWPTANDAIFCTTDERVGAVVRFYDRASSLPISQMTVGGTTMPHNAYIVGDYCHVSWYAEGWVMLDIRDPARPERVAAYDTWPAAAGGFNGCWSIFPLLPSGRVFVCDTSTGLYVVQPNVSTLRVDHAPLADTIDEDGPYTVAAQVTSNEPLTSVQMFYRQDQGPYVAVAMTPSGPPGSYTAAIPGHLAPARLSYYIEATDSRLTRRHPIAGSHAFLVGSKAVLWFDDFENNLGWIGSAGSEWQRGPIAGRAGQSAGGWEDPIRAWSGQYVIGVDLGSHVSQTFAGSYQANSSSNATSPTIPTNGQQGLRLRFRRWLSVEPADLATIVVNGIPVWSNPTTTLSERHWELVDLDIANVTDTAATVQLRFTLTTNGSLNLGGWNIDDVELYSPLDCVPPRHYGVATTGTGNIAPQIGLTGVPSIGSSFTIDGTNVLGGTATLLVVGTQMASFPIFGIQGLVNPLDMQLLAATATGQPGLPGGGTVSFPFVVPNDPLLDNFPLAAQIVPIDLGSPNGFLASSDGLRFRVCLQ